MTDRQWIKAKIESLKANREDLGVKKLLVDLEYKVMYKELGKQIDELEAQLNSKPETPDTK